MRNIKIKVVGTPEELLEAQRLRFQVFNIEMKAGLASSFQEGIDKDEFDKVCEHLIIVDENHQKTIGTYRMLLKETANKNKGFYSEQEFNLENIKQLEGSLLEVGRSCVHKDYRRKSILFLLWQGIARYAMDHNVRYIFGCSSIFTIDPKQVSTYFCALKALGYFSDISVYPIDEKHTMAIDEQIQLDNPNEIFEQLPPLFKGYMSLGLKVCGYPVVDRDFKTTDFFVLLDIKQMGPSYKKRLFGNYLEDKAVVNT